MAYGRLALSLVQMKMMDSPEENMATEISMTERAASDGADIFCPPELFLSMYFAQRVPPPAMEQAGVAVKVPGSETRALGSAPGRIVWSSCRAHWVGRDGRDESGLRPKRAKPKMKSISHSISGRMSFPHRVMSFE